jgi:hypothetical protein
MNTVEKNTTPSPVEKPEAWLSPGRVLLLVAALFVAAFPGVIFGTSSFFRLDYGVIGFPALNHFVESVRSTKIPLWNPYSNCGAPFLAQWGTMCLYPGNVLLLLFPLPWALGVFSLAHLVLGAAGMCRLARHWTGDAVAAAFAAFAFVFNGAVLSSLIWPNYCVALAWMPWLVLVMQRTWRDGGRWLPVAALIGAMQMLVGVPELVLLTWVFIGGLWLVDRKQAKSQPLWLISIPAVVLLVTGLSAAQLLPFFDLLDQSQRAGAFHDPRWPMPIWGWANFFVPLFHYFESTQGFNIQQGQIFLSSYYPGLAVIAFAFLAIWRKRDARTWLLLGLTLFVMILALGSQGILYALLVKFVPGGGVVRYPIKFVLLTSLTLPLLAAIGIAAFRSDAAEKEPRRYRDLTAVIVAVIIEVLLLVALAHGLANNFDILPQLRLNTAGRLILFGLCMLAFLKGGNAEIAPRLRRIYLTLALIFLGADLLTHLPNQNPAVPASVLSSEIDLPGRPRFTGTMQRAMISPAAEQALLRSSVTPWNADLTGKRLALWSNLNLLENVPKVNGSMTLRQGYQDELQKRLYPDDPATAPAAEGLKDFLGVRWFTREGEIIAWAERAGALPLVTAGQATRPAPDTDALLDELVSTNFIPDEHVWLNADTAKPRVTATVTNLIFGSGKLQFEVEAEAPSVAVIAQSYNRNWQARVNGGHRSVLRANHAFQAVEIPAGKSYVRLDYVDRAFWNGFAISALSALLCLSWITAEILRSRRNRA